MAEYLSTKEVAAYLRLNEKRVYALVAAGEIPAARVSGKWLFPRHLIDQWVDGHTQRPVSGRMESLAEDLLVVQGSDDGLFEEVCGRFRNLGGVQVVEAQVGSLGGLAAVEKSRAHMAGCHVENSVVEGSASSGRYLLSLFRRQQGIMFDRGRVAEPRKGVKELVGPGVAVADRQSQSGTYRMTRRLLAAEGCDAGVIHSVGPFNTHLGVALAVARGAAHFGVGSSAAASACGLGFVPLEEETFKLAVPLKLASHASVARFCSFAIEQLGVLRRGGPAGYSFDVLGNVEFVGSCC